MLLSQPHSSIITLYSFDILSGYGILRHFLCAMLHLRGICTSVMGEEIPVYTTKCSGMMRPTADIGGNPQ